jgi:hypothetical protein
MRLDHKATVSKLATGIPHELTEAADWFFEEPAGGVELTPDGIELHGGAYVIGLDRLRNPMQLVRWIRHLADKTWFGRDDVARLIDCACEVRGWKARGL